MSDAGFGRLSDAPATFLVTGARVVDPSRDLDEVADLGVRDGVIIAPGDVPAGAERIDGHGLVVAPGFCDLHVHLRDPGDPAAEHLHSGARAAAHGGFTTVCAMPNTEPPIDDAAAVTDLLARARDAACRVRVIGAVTMARAGEVLADLAGMTAAGAIGFSDDGSAVPSDGLAREALAALAGVDRPLIEHAEDPALAAGGVMRAGPVAAALGLRGWPPEAELAVVERDLALAEDTGARIHLTHLSTAGALAAVRAAKARGVAVTCDVTPHHLALTEAWVGGDRHFAWEEPGPIGAGATRAFDGACRVNPPLTTRDDALALLEGLADGTVDAIATDHAPHPANRKLVPFEEAAPGLIGLETALSLGLAAVAAGRLTLVVLVAALSSRPAAIIGEPRGLEAGAPADLVLFDPDARWRVEAGALASVSSNTPLLDMELPGVVRLTVAGGRVTYRG
ncbi:MAG TPA: dihydroorotase [Patescibacteria group bacterium]|nr:dihydroorotase [Patescibacteria group bacterium]